VAVRPRFDPKLPLVAARDFTFMGVAYAPGAPFNPEGVPDRLRARQYEARAVNHGEAVASDDQPTEQVTMTGPAGGRYTITAPWLDEPEVVRGKVNAEKRLAELREAGAPLGFIEGGSAVTVEEGEGGGWYEVNAPWLDEPEKVQGREAAEARQQELNAAGEPDSYKGYTLTAGENGWYAITKDGVEPAEGADEPVSLKVQGEDNAREAVAQLRAGEAPADTALPAEWTEQADEGGDTNDSESVQTEGGEPNEENVTMTDQDKKPVDGDKPNEPGTNQPNGAEVINDQKVADGTAAEANGDGDGEGGDGTTGTVGP
jgi:hypothetical protein